MRLTAYQRAILLQLNDGGWHRGIRMHRQTRESLIDRRLLLWTYDPMRRDWVFRITRGGSALLDKAQK